MTPLCSLAAASLLLGEPPASTQTTVELRVTSVDDGDAKLLEQLLMRQLGDRLLEDGYRVVPVGDAASVRVWIHLDADEAIVDTRGAGHQVERVADGDPQVMALELQQLTTASIDAVQPADSEPRAAIMVEMVESGGEPRDPQLRDRLQIGLLERGFALTRVPTVGDARVCVASDASGLFVHVVAGTDSCSASGAKTRVAAVGSVEVERELLLDEASASLERFAASASPEPVSIAPEPITDDLPRLDAPVDVTAPAAARVPRPVSVTVAAFGGVLGRGGGTDPAFGMELRAGVRRGLGGSLALTVVPSRAEQLRVVEYMPTATFDWRLGFAARGLAMLGVFAGAHVHTYSYSGTSTEHGTRVSASGGASVRMGFLANRGALLFGGVRAGWSGGQWVHLVDGDPSWRRSSVMVGVELGAGWDFGLRGRR